MKEEMFNPQPSPEQEDGTGEPTATPKEPQQSVDPIDKLKSEEMRTILASRDVTYLGSNLSDDDMRRELKKLRSIAQRKGEGKADVSVGSTDPQPVIEQTNTTSSSPFLTREDFYRANEKKAERMFREQHPDLAENFDDIRLLYMARRGKETPEDILEDFYDGAVIYQARNPKKKEDTGKQAVRDLTAQPVVKSGGEAKEPKKAQKEPDPRFKPKSTPDSWYPKKEE